MKNYIRLVILSFASLVFGELSAKNPEKIVVVSESRDVTPSEIWGSRKGCDFSYRIGEIEIVVHAVGGAFARIGADYLYSFRKDEVPVLMTYSRERKFLMVITGRVDAHEGGGFAAWSTGPVHLFYFDSKAGKVCHRIILSTHTIRELLKSPDGSVFNVIRIEDIVSFPLISFFVAETVVLDSSGKSSGRAGSVVWNVLTDTPIQFTELLKP